MPTIAADPKRLGVKIGITSVLHRWGSAMTHHPHVHMIVPGGGISLDGTRWIGCRPNYLLPAGESVAAVPPPDAGDAARRTPRRPPAVLRRPRPPAGKAAFKAYLAPLHRTKWFVYSKRPFAGSSRCWPICPATPTGSRSPNSRLIAADATGVTFSYKDYRIEGPGRYKTMTLKPDEFIRRFLIHVLPCGSHRIRHCGLLASGTTIETIARARQMLAAGAPVQTVHHQQPSASAAANDQADPPVPVLRRAHEHHRDQARLDTSITGRPVQSPSGSIRHDHDRCAEMVHRQPCPPSAAGPAPTTLAQMRRPDNSASLQPTHSITVSIINPSYRCLPTK